MLFFLEFPLLSIGHPSFTLSNINFFIFFPTSGDKYRDIPFPCLLDLSLPYAEVSCDGEVCVAKADGSGGALNLATCAEQLLYEIGDPGAYITPDVVSCISIFMISFKIT